MRVAVKVPFVFPYPKKIAEAATYVMGGRTLNLAYDFDGAAWDMWSSMNDLLTDLEYDKNLLVLPPGSLRVMQVIFDGHGWTSKAGACRFTLRCVHTERDHNATRNAVDPMFMIGSDKHEHLSRGVKVGDHGTSMHDRMYAGLTVTQRSPSEMPAHVRADELFLPLASIECAPCEEPSPPPLASCDLSHMHIQCQLPYRVMLMVTERVRRESLSLIDSLYGIHLLSDRFYSCFLKTH